MLYIYIYISYQLYKHKMVGAFMICMFPMFLHDLHRTVADLCRPCGSASIQWLVTSNSGWMEKNDGIENW